MRMRPTHGVAVVFAAALAATVGSPGPAQAFFFLPMFQQSQQPQPEGRSGRSSGDNNRWKRDRGSDDDAEPAKPSGGTRVKRNEEKLELQLVGQERKVAGEVRVQLLAGTAHPQRSSGAASEQE